MSRKAEINQPQQFLSEAKNGPASVTSTGYVVSWCRFNFLFIGLLFISGWSTNVVAQPFKVSDAKTELVGDVYYLNASLKYDFSGPAMAALDSGVTLTLALDIEVYSPSRYLWDDVIATLEQRYEISYQALTDQYLLRNLNSGSQFYYSTLGSALFTLGNIMKLPIIDSYLLEDDRHYMVRVQSRLDFYGLPVPLKLKAYLSSDWWLSSGWYSWDL